MISESPSLAEVVQHGVEAALSDVFKAGPGIVKVYDPITNTAFVQPAIKHAVYSTTSDERTFKEVGEIPFVPVIFPRAGGKTMRLPVDVGDTVLLVYCDAGLAEWRESGGVAEPEDARRHSIGWPVAIPGFFPDSKPPPPLDGAEVAAGAAIFGEENGPAKMFVGGTLPGFRFGQLAISPVALAVPLLAYVTAASAAATAGGASDTAVASALVAIQAALAALVAIPANAVAASAVTASGTAVTAAGTATGAAATAATAAGLAATTAAGAVPSTLVKSL